VKFLAQYSKSKFINFSFDAQLKAFAKMLQELEKNIANTAYRQDIVSQIDTLLPFVHKPLPRRMHKLLNSLPDDPHRLLRALALYHNDSLVKDGSIILRVGDGSVQPDEQKIKQAQRITLVADNLRSVFNVGSLFRLCECLSLGELVLCGISPTPLHPNMNKTALGTTDKVKWSKQEQTKTAIDSLKVKGYRIYALETAQPSTSVFEFQASFPLAMIVGNEALGVEPAILKECDEIIYLPVLGWKNSLNVSVAASVAIYQILFGGRNADL